jgi:hypothetical protein
MTPLIIHVDINDTSNHSRRYKSNVIVLSKLFLFTATIIFNSVLFRFIWNKFNNFPMTLEIPCIYARLCNNLTIRYKGGKASLTWADLANLWLVAVGNIFTSSSRIIQLDF